MATLAKFAKLIGLPVGAVGAGAAAWLSLAHSAHSTVATCGAAAVSVIGLCLARAPTIIRALSDAAEKRAKAATDSDVRKLHAQTRTDLMKQGVDVEKTNQVAIMLSYLLLDPSLPPDQRLNDMTMLEMAKLLPKPRTFPGSPVEQALEPPPATSAISLLPPAQNSSDGS